MTNPRRPKAQPRTVDFFQEPTDYEVAFLATMGYSTAYIMETTGLTFSQVSYRIRAAGLTKENHMSRADARNGTSPFSTILIRAAEPLFRPRLQSHIHATWDPAKTTRKRTNKQR